MPVPGHQDLMLPLLQFTAPGERSIKQAIEHLSNEFCLTEDERQQFLPTGRKLLMRSRVEWAATDLVQAGLLRRPLRGRIELTERGREVLHAPPQRIDRAYLVQFPEFVRFLQGARDPRQQDTQIAVDGTIMAALVAAETARTEAASGPPEERIEAALGEAHSSLRQDLLSRIIAADFKFFELLVIDLMQAMGYGGTQAEPGRHLGGSGDSGIDGVINGDPLGLDVVYLQAKKYAANNSVGRPEVQAFVGSLVGRGAQKGVFMTTSAFSQLARQYAASVPHRVILIDGEQLTSLMIQYGVGVRTSFKVELKRVDLDYFGITDDQ